MKKAWIIVAALLCGCGDRETSAPAPAAASPPAAAARVDERPVIACFGDSLTAGAGLEPSQSYPEVLQRELDQKGYRYRVVNHGVSGDTTQDGLARLPLVVADKPAVVVVEFGANDGLRGQPVPTAAANLKIMIEELRKSGAQVVLAGMTLPPNYGPEYIRRFEAMYKDLAAEYKLPLIPFFLEGVGGKAELMQRDGLHPTVEGTRIVAATVLKYIEPALKK
jgi:acyl-CoA thioesterase-1